MPRDQIWLGLLSDKYDMRLSNYGKGGSTVSDFVTTYYPMCQRYESMANNKADIILLEGGRNDFNQGVPIGAVDSKDTKTFSGALNVIIEGLKKKYPNAMIVCISNWNFPGSKTVLITPIMQTLWKLCQSDKEFILFPRTILKCRVSI